MFAHKKDIVRSITNPHEAGLLNTIQGQVYVSENDKIATNYYGEQFVVNDDYMNEMMKIEPKTLVKRKIDSPFVKEHMEQLRQASGLNWDEDKSYIEGRQNGWKYRDSDPLDETYNG